MNERPSLNSYDPSRLTSYDPSQAAKQAAPQTNGYDPNSYTQTQTGGYEPNSYGASQASGYGQPQPAGYDTNGYGASQTNSYGQQQANSYGAPQTGGFGTAQTAGFAGAQMSGMNYNGGSGFDQQTADLLRTQAALQGGKQLGGKGLLAVGIFLAGIVAMVITSRTAPALCVSIFGGMFAGFGILAMLDKQKKYPEEKVTSLSFVLLGLIFLVIPLYIHSISKSGKFTSEEVKARLKTVIGAASMCIGLAVIVLPLITGKMKKNRCTLSIEAKCVEILSRLSGGSSHGRRHRHRVFAPVWEYWCDGRQIRKAESTYSNINVPQVGSTAELMVNPDDPEDFYRRNTAAKYFTIFIGAVFFGVGLLILFVA